MHLATELTQEPAVRDNILSSTLRSLVITVKIPNWLHALNIGLIHRLPIQQLTAELTLISQQREMFIGGSIVFRMQADLQIDYYVDRFGSCLYRATHGADRGSALAGTKG